VSDSEPSLRAQRS